MWDVLLTRMEGRVVVLEPLREEHFDGLWAAAQDERIWTWKPLRCDDRATFDGYVRSGIEQAAARQEVPFATLDAHSGAPIGSTRFLSLRPEHRGVEIGHTWVTPERWGSGANVEAKYLMLRHAFEQAGCMRVELKTDARNERSRQALEALGAQFEGIHRKHMLRPYGVRDSAWYSVVDDEWPAVKARLEERLAAKLQTG
jgi:RimJ/RimL family protein N-acetyltransferase